MNNIQYEQRPKGLVVVCEDYQLILDCDFRQQIIALFAM